MINKSLLWKLTLAFLLVAIITTALVAVFIRVTSADRLSRLIIEQQRSDLQTALATYYSEKGSWDGVSENWPQVVRARVRIDATEMAPSNDPKFTQGKPPGGELGSERRSFFGLVDGRHVVLISNDPQYPVGSSMPAEALKNGVPVMVDGKQVGTMVTPPLPPTFNREENLFLQRTTEALLYAVAGSMVLALLLGLVLARTLIRPVQALTQAAQNMAAGDLEQKVVVSSKDEIGQLATAFNQMSAEVARVNQQRRQMTADIAHDLRTPLTVIAGYVEAMQDGVLKPTPERLGMIYTEIERLQNLVGDLRMLSQADAGELPLHPRPVPPKNLLETVAAPFQYRAEKQGVALKVEAEEGLPDIQVDEDRMMQVFGNLINNAVRYTPAGGVITLKAARADGQVVLVVEDTGEGIAAEEMPFIFDRFHRADKSRHTDAGESGLGLAIVKALVEAHGGTVKAASTYGQGTRIEIRIPCL